MPKAICCGADSVANRSLFWPGRSGFGTSGAGGGESLAGGGQHQYRARRKTHGARSVRRFCRAIFRNYRVRPREIRQTLQSLGSGFIVDPAGYIVTNEHVVERAADLKIEVTTNDGKTYNAHYITGDEKKDLAFIKIDARDRISFYQS